MDKPKAPSTFRELGEMFGRVASGDRAALDAISPGEGGILIVGADPDNPWRRLAEGKPPFGPPAQDGSK